MLEPATRRVTVVLCTPAGEVLGALDPVELPAPWWTGVSDVVEAVRLRHGVDVTVLRLLDYDRRPSKGGAHLVHLAQLESDALPAGLDLLPVPPVPQDALADHPWRQSYARPGGPRTDLAWAEAVLARRGTPRIGRAEQVRTWNLSSIWRIPTADGAAWLKAVPSFFAHEGAMLDVVRQVTDALPPLLGFERGRVLLGAVDGEDLYQAPGDVQVEMVRLLVGLQAALVGRADDILATGAFDWRPAAFEPLAHDVVARTADRLDPDTRHALNDLLRGLPARYASVESCGIPDTLVHGDFHPGNVRGDGTRLALMDWGDSGLGNPLLDQAAFLAYVAAGDRERVQATWSAAWRAAVPGSDPDRAAALLAPVAALRQAVIYRLFLDEIEPRERVYHEADPPMWLTEAARAFRAG